METILHNRQVWFTADGRLEVYNHKLATKLNKFFKKYDNGKYKFEEHEEAVFNVPPNQIGYIRSLFFSQKSTIDQGVAT